MDVEDSGTGSSLPTVEEKEAKCEVRVDLALATEEQESSTDRDKVHARQWSELCVDFTQTTTCHGVRFITAPSKFFIRRVTWTLFLLGATALFLYLMLSKLIFFFEYNQTVSVAVVYNKTMKFPAVTVCNQNQFELTAVHKLSMMDALRTVRLKEENGTEYGEDQKNSRLFTLVGHMCKLPEKYTKRKTKVINEVPRYICRDICLKIFDSKCHGLLYNRDLKQCIILGFEYVFESQKYSDCDVSHSWEVYLRDLNFKCMFEDENCSHITDEYLGECRYESSIITVNKINEMLNSYLLPGIPYDITDVTVGLSVGRVLAFTFNFNLGSLNPMETPKSDPECNYWSIITPPFKSKKMCLELFYYLGLSDIAFTAFTISLIQDEYEVTEIDRISPEHESHINGTWNRLFYKLPDGLFKIRIRAEHDIYGPFDIVIIDNLSIQKCSAFYQQSCKGFYMDGMSTTVTINEALPYCDCHAGWFRCAEDGLCIPDRLTCNGQADCTDGSDELLACADKTDITCEFEDQYICGYKAYGWVKQRASINTLQDSAEEDGNYNPLGLSMSPNSVDIISWDLVYLISPQKTFETQFSLSFKFISRSDFEFAELLIVRRNDSHVYAFRLQTHFLDESGWSVENQCLPPGTYAVVFRAMSTKGNDLLRTENSRWPAVDTVNAIDMECAYTWSRYGYGFQYGHETCSLNITGCYDTDYWFRRVHGGFSLYLDNYMLPIHLHVMPRITSPLVKLQADSCLSFNVQTEFAITVAVNIATIVGANHVQQSYFKLNIGHNLVKLNLEGSDSHFIATWIFFVDAYVYDRDVPRQNKTILSIHNIFLNNSNLCHCNDKSVQYESGKFVICNEVMTPFVWNDESEDNFWLLKYTNESNTEYASDLFGRDTTQSTDESVPTSYLDDTIHRSTPRYNVSAPDHEDRSTFLGHDTSIAVNNDNSSTNGIEPTTSEYNPSIEVTEDNRFSNNDAHISFTEDIMTPSVFTGHPAVTTERIRTYDFDEGHLNDTLVHKDGKMDDNASSIAAQYINDIDVTISHIAAINSSNFLNESAHKFDNFLLGCSWNRAKDKKCSQVKQVHTDLGVCYTFNGNPQNPLNTSATGMGLSMLLNVEQYGYMKGYTDYAGVKVFLHDQEELHFVRDLGIAVPPGMQALVAVKYSELTSVKAPWGNCSNEPSKYYENDGYTRLRCLRSCETEELLEACGCRDSYMQGPGDVCNVSAYLQCARNNDKSFGKKCDCYGPCKSRSFSGDVSYSHISLLHSDNLLDATSKTDIKANVLMSDEVRHRTENSIVKTITLLQNVANEYDVLMTFIQRSFLIDSTLIVKLNWIKNAIVGGLQGDMQSLGRNVDNKHLNSAARQAYQLFPSKPEMIRLSQEIQMQLARQDKSITSQINAHLRGSWTKFELAHNINVFSNFVSDMRNLVEEINDRILTPLNIVLANYTSRFYTLYDNFEADMKRSQIQELFICAKPYIIEELVELHWYRNRTCKMDGSFTYVHTRVIIHSFINSLMAITEEIKAQLYTNHINLEEAVHTLRNHMEAYSNAYINLADTQTENDFIKSNLIELDVFYGELKYESVVQKPAYDMISFFSDFGGYMGLLLGCSVVTVLEVLDLFIYNALVKCKHRKKVMPMAQMQNLKRAQTLNAQEPV